MSAGQGSRDNQALTVYMHYDDVQELTVEWWLTGHHILMTFCLWSGVLEGGDPALLFTQGLQESLRPRSR